LRTFDRLAKMFDAFVSSEDRVSSESMLIGNDLVIGSKAGHPFFLKLLETLAARVTSGECSVDSKCVPQEFFATTLDAFITESWGEPVTLLPHSWFPKKGSVIGSDLRPFAEMHNPCADCKISTDPAVIYKLFSGIGLLRPFASISHLG
jgi:hypothetical protein